MNILEMRDKFRSLLMNVDRDGMDRLLDWLGTTDFYVAPASTRFHLSCEGGLLRHSLNVYKCLKAKTEAPVWESVLQDVPMDSIVISALLHDLCKADFYKKVPKNQKTYDPEKVGAAERWQVKHDDNGDFIWETVMGYEFDDQMPIGHGEKSVILASKFIELTDDEIYAIRWHMGFSEDRSQYQSLGLAMEKCPLVLALHEADLEASKLFEGKDGNIAFL